MGVKTLIFLAALIVLISACSVEKTKPVVTDIGGEVKQEEPKVEEKIAEEKETVPEGGRQEVEEGEIEVTEKEEKEQEKEQEAVLPPGTHVIKIKDLKLDPRELSIRRGDTVIWEHEDEWEKDGETKHYLAAHTNEFRSPVLYYGDKFEHTFGKAGTFTYIDIVYKDRDYMRGKIIVE